MRKPLLAVAAVASSLALAACSTTTSRDPLTGQTVRTWMSPAQEKELGASENSKVLAQFGGVNPDATAVAYVQKVGEKVRKAAAQAEPSAAASLGDSKEQIVTGEQIASQPFTFTNLNDPMVNAFALPGGYVYTTRGILALANDEAELAGVLGHEIGHVTARHSAQRADTAQMAGIAGVLGQVAATVLGGVLAGDQGARLGGQLGSQAVQYGVTGYVNGYSREQEFEADQLGIRYMAAAGYDPKAMGSFLQALESDDRYQRSLGDKGEEVPNWLSTHPRTPDRVIAAAEAVKQVDPGANERNREQYLAAIDGVIYGDDPKQGFVRGNTFQHPEMRIAFNAPEGYRLKNTSEAVLGTNRQGRIFVFDAAPGSGNPATYLERDWFRGKQINQVQTVEVGGRPAAVGFLQVQIGNRQGVALAAAVPGDSGQMWRFIYAQPGDLSTADVQTYERSLRSFRRLTPSEAAALKPLRIRIVPVRAGDTIDSLARQMQGVENPRELFVVLNGFDRGRQLTVGDSVKIVRPDGGGGSGGVPVAEAVAPVPPPA
ncbi:MAG: M48 family metalloprotease [Geminicoccaceae bacterium]